MNTIWLFIVCSPGFAFLFAWVNGDNVQWCIGIQGIATWTSHMSSPIKPVNDFVVVSLVHALSLHLWKTWAEQKRTTEIIQNWMVVFKSGWLESSKIVVPHRDKRTKIIQNCCYTETKELKSSKIGWLLFFFLVPHRDKRTKIIQNWMIIVFFLVPYRDKELKSSKIEWLLQKIIPIWIITDGL